MRSSIYRFINVATLLMALIFIGGCGTLTNAGKQSIYVQTILNNKLVDGVDCNIKNRAGSWHVVSSNDIILEKGLGELIIECQSKDKKYVGKEIVSSEANGSIWTNIFTLGAGAVIDAVSASGFDYPSNIIVVMKQSIPAGENVK